MSTDFRFIGIAPSVDLTERRSKMINDQTEPFTLDEMRGYKVFTALLTQSGGDDPFGIDTGLLDIGVTYYINNDSLGMDFTNVGSPSNNTGTYFVATGITPNSWGANQGTGNGTLAYNLGSPVATVLENTIGNVWFSYGGTNGYYNISAIDLFNERTGLLLEPLSTINGNGYTQVENKTNSTLSIVTLDTVSGPTNGLLVNTMIEIRVYN